MAWAELTDVRCYYELLGDGEPLLLIPGLGTTCRLWDPVIPELASRFSLILPDNRDVGRSIGKRKPHALSDLVADLVELLDELQLERAHVLGLSLGGVIAQRLAADHPSRVERLVLISCAGGFTPYLRHVAGLLGHALRHFPKEMYARTIELLGTAPGYFDAHLDLVEQRVAAKCSAPVSARAVGAQLRCLASASFDPQFDGIVAPTLVIAGEHDALIPNCYAREMAATIPGSRFEVIPGAGHNPLIDEPEQVLPLLIAFLEQAKDAAPCEGPTADVGPSQDELWKEPFLMRRARV